MRITPYSAAAGGAGSSREELALGRLQGLLGKLGLLEPLPQLVDLGLLLVALPQLLLNRLQLLAEEVLALPLVDLRLDLRLDLRPELDHLELPGEDLGRTPQALVTSTSSRSSCFSVVAIAAPAIRCVSAEGSSILVTASWSSSGRYGICSMISENERGRSR